MEVSDSYRFIIVWWFYMRLISNLLIEQLVYLKMIKVNNLGRVSNVKMRSLSCYCAQQTRPDKPTKKLPMKAVCSYVKFSCKMTKVMCHYIVQMAGPGIGCLSCWSQGTLYKNTYTISLHCFNMHKAFKNVYKFVKTITSYINSGTWPYFVTLWLNFKALLHN